MKIKLSTIFIIIISVSALCVGCALKSDISLKNDDYLATITSSEESMSTTITVQDRPTASITTIPTTTMIPAFDRNSYQGIEKIYVFTEEALMVNIIYDDISNMYNAVLIDSATNNYEANAEPLKIIEEGRIDFSFSSISMAKKIDAVDITLSFVFSNNDVTLLLNNENKECQIFDNDMIEDARLLFDISLKIANTPHKPTEEQWLTIAGIMENFDYNNTLRNIRSIGSLYSDNSNPVVINGYITNLNADNINGIYIGIIKQTKNFNDYYWTFLFEGDSFPYINGDYIGVYGIIYSDDTIDLIDNNGRITNTIQVPNIHIVDYCPGIIDNYKLSVFEKSFYFNSYYANDSGQSISLTLDEINGHKITISSIRKYGNGTIQISYRYDEEKYDDDAFFYDDECCFLNPSGRIYINHYRDFDDGSVIHDGNYYKAAG